jgi:hypothetical protein
MIMVSLLGMNPTVAFPIMMGSCAFLMPVAGLRFIKTGRYDLRAALGLTLGGAGRPRGVSGRSWTSPPSLARRGRGPTAVTLPSSVAPAPAPRRRPADHVLVIPEIEPCDTPFATMLPRCRTSAAPRGHGRRRSGAGWRAGRPAPLTLTTTAPDGGVIPGSTQAGEQVSPALT